MSGKKGFRVPRKRSKKQYQRSVEFPITLTEETGLGVKLKIENGEVIVCSEKTNERIDHGKFSTVYQGENKKRYINEIPSGKIYTDSNYAVGDFETFYSIDTNTITTNGFNVSFGTILQWDLFDDKLKKEFKVNSLSFGNGSIVYLPDAIEKIENYMWSFFLSSLNDGGHLDLTKKTAIIVDSDKDNLDKYNKGEEFFKGIIDQKPNPMRKLPDSFKFVYANSNKKNESIFNTLINTNDHIAKIVLDRFQNEKGDYKDRNEIQDALRNKEVISAAYAECIKDLEKIKINFTIIDGD